MAWCRAHEVAAQVHARGAPVPDQFDLLVPVGGDGTLLRAAALVYPRETPLLGVHAGGLGFLAACDSHQIERALEGVARGEVWNERRARVLVSGASLSVSALNEVALVGASTERFTELEINIRGAPALTVEGDGVVVSTPTGSTAYALAAGGPVIAPDVHALLIVPLAPHRLGLRPVVLSGEATVSICARCLTHVLVDGDVAGTLNVGDAVEVGLAPAATVLIRLEETGSLFARLRDRLGWPG